jgi:hypothetical protein
MNRLLLICSVAVFVTSGIVVESIAAPARASASKTSPRAKAKPAAQPKALVTPLDTTPDIGSPEWNREQQQQETEERHIREIMKICRCE